MVYSDIFFHQISHSLFKTLKREEVYLWEYETFSDVTKRIPYFIEDMYNKKRLHSSSGYRLPEEYERLLAKKGSRECIMA
jgi:transposase InsO family protein